MSKTPLDTEQVLDAAAIIADRDGLDNLTLTRIAETLGVAQPALYRHVDSYSDLIRLLGLRAREILAESLANSAIGVSGDDAIVAIGYAWRSVVAEHPGLYAATDRFPCAGDQELEAAVERIVEIICQSLAGFKLNDDYRVHVARSLRSAFHGFSHLESGDGHPQPHALDDSFDSMIRLMCAGIRYQAD